MLVHTSLQCQLSRLTSPRATLTSCQHDSSHSHLQPIQPYLLCSPTFSPFVQASCPLAKFPLVQHGVRATGMNARRCFLGFCYQSSWFSRLRLCLCLWICFPRAFGWSQQRIWRLRVGNSIVTGIGPSESTPSYSVHEVQPTRGSRGEVALLLKSSRNSSKVPWLWNQLIAQPWLSPA